jgi:hypothetical protein
LPIFGALSRVDEQVKECNAEFKDLYECVGVQSAIQQFSAITDVGTELIFPFSAIEKVKDIISEVLALLLLNDAVEAAIQYKANVLEEISETKTAQEKLVEKKLTETAALLGKTVAELKVLGTESKSSSSSSMSSSNFLSREQQEELFRATANTLGISVEKLTSLQREKEEAERVEALLKQAAQLLGVDGSLTEFRS